MSANQKRALVRALQCFAGPEGFVYSGVSHMKALRPRQCRLADVECTSLNSQKGLTEIQHNEFTETMVRDSPSLVWGRPAKSVVERPRGFKSHIPRQAPFAK